MTRVCHLNPSKLDHLPILMEIRSAMELPSRMRGRRFRFEEMWLRDESCEETVSSTWSKLVVGLPLFQLCEMIRFTRYALLAWKNELFGSTKAEIAKVQWLQEGDINTKFFHLRASNRKQKNHIKGLRYSTRVWQDTRVGIEDTVAEYFPVSGRLRPCGARGCGSLFTTSYYRYE
ncbi:hypothetical protein ACFX11_012942 [Malus domestica]